MPRNAASDRTPFAVALDRSPIRLPVVLILLAAALQATSCNCGSDNTSTEPDDDPAPITSVTLTVSAGNAQSFRVDDTLDLQASATDANGKAATGTYTWTSSNPAVASVAPLAANGNARVTALATGEVTITVRENATQRSSSIALTTLQPALSEIRMQPATVSLEFGGTIEIVAEAVKQSDGSVVSVPLVWSTSDGSVATVTPSSGSGDRAIVAGAGEGEAKIMVVEPSQTSVVGEVTVTVASARAVIYGTLFDTDGTTPVNDIVLSLGVTAGYTGTRANGRTGQQNQTDPTPVAAGGFRFTVDPAQYALFSVGVQGLRWISTPGDTALVQAGEQRKLDLFVKDGYHLDLTGTNIGSVQGTPGTTMNLTIRFQVWNRDMCPGCSPAIAIGVDGNALAVHRFGIVGIFPGQSGTVSIPITVPTTGGTIYAMHVSASTAAGIQPGLDQYTNTWNANLASTRFIPIGTLAVSME